MSHAEEPAKVSDGTAPLSSPPERSKARATDDVWTMRKEAAIVAAVLSVFGFCGMHFFLGERVEKSLFIGLLGGVIGSFRFVTRSIRARR